MMKINHNLLAEWLSWIIAVPVSAWVTYLCVSIVQPEIIDEIVTFLFG